ncbi:MAG: hypothetical protein IJT73_03700 [Selenomonadaceae bacterium]|nr:hypothetical protein [Selenomonadaceae bacterium]
MKYNEFVDYFVLIFTAFVIVVAGIDILDSDYLRATYILTSGALIVSFNCYCQIRDVRRKLDKRF